MCLLQAFLAVCRYLFSLDSLFSLQGIKVMVIMTVRNDIQTCGPLHETDDLGWVLIMVQQEKTCVQHQKIFVRCVNDKIGGI